MKHLLLTAMLLLFTTAIYAQLHVQPNPSSLTDSYVYANDVVLYVHQGVSLIENNEDETKASIYLRGDAQLIQGDKPGGSINSGTGKLSVWQRGRTNNFGYHNWATPVGNPALSVSGNTNFGITSFYDVQPQSLSVDPHPTHSIQQIPTGGLNGTRVPLSISNRWIYVLRGLGTYSNWVYIGNNDGILPGDGYTMKGTIGTTASNTQLYDFRGRPNDGTIPKGPVAENINVYLGNPYPSHIDMRDFLVDNPGLQGWVWYYEKSEAVQSHNLTAIQSGYGTWVPAGGTDTIDDAYGGGNEGIYTAPTFVMYNGDGTPIPGPTYGTGTAAEARFAQVGQGFMVRGSADPSPVVFTNAMRRYIPANYYNTFKNATNKSAPSFTANIPSTAPNPVADFYKVDATIRFHIEINNSYMRDMVLMFSDNSTKGKDRGFDARHPSVIAAGDAFWKLEDETESFVIQTRPFDVSDVIPLGIRTKNGANTFTIKVAERHNFTQNMFLYDLQNNHYQRLGPNNDAVINYSGGAGTITDRFFIVFRRGVQDTNIPKTIAEMNIDFFQNNRISQLEVYNPEVIDIKTARVYDMSGKKVIEEHNLGKQQRYSFSTANLSTGVYIVVLTTVDDLVIDYKVTVQNKN